MLKNLGKQSLLVLACVGLAACDGDDGNDGSNGSDGANSLVQQTNLGQGDSNCFAGGVQVDSGIDSDVNGVLSANEINETSYLCSANAIDSRKNFNRIASFPVCTQINATCNDDTETSAEIVAVSQDGLTLVYTDSPENQIGFVDIAAPAAPAPLGTLALAGEPTSIAIVDNNAIVGVNTSADFVNVSGTLDVIDITSQTNLRSIDVGGQPDSVAVSPDGTYAAVIIENERDESLGDGAPPQSPAGTLVIVELTGLPAYWTTRTVDLTGIADLFPGDPEPEYVDINSDNIAVVTLQENNYLALVNLVDGSIINHFSAGSVDLDQIDGTEEDRAIISLTESQMNVLREPDGVAWINSNYFATADEGDLDGGSRGFTVFNTAGEVVYSSGNSLDHRAVRFGHYPDDRSGNKGNEPENVEVGIYGDHRYLFVSSERSSLVFVYDVADPTRPIYKQALPAGAGPEGVLAIPSRNLLVTASEVDDRDDKVRSVINIYNHTTSKATYPTIRSADRTNGTPIPWSAISGLAADQVIGDYLYAVEDSFYGSNRIFGIDVNETPALLDTEIKLSDANDIFAGITTVAVAGGTAKESPSRINVFDSEDLKSLINTDKSINVDPEGIAVSSDGGFWVASEGSGTVGDAARPVNSLNFIFKTDRLGVIEDVITLPNAINDVQLRFGFEGIAEYNGSIYVAFQRAWNGEANPRIGVYNVATETWRFLFYPIDAAASQNGGWVGLSDLTSLGNGEFLVVERDNQAGPDAAIKRLYRFDVTGLVDGGTITKTLVRDLLAEGDLTAPGGLVYEKIEGAAVLENGDLLIINDNDGVDDNSGETQLINLGQLLP